MKLKTGIKISDLNSAVVLAAVVADGIYRELGVSTGVTITSGTDGDHSERSLHYTSNTPDGKGRALDLRVWDLPTEEDRQVAVRKLRERLTSDFDVVLEPTHIHVEYDPEVQIGMPVGPYETFAACVAAQKRKGHDEESARRICGEIEKKTREAASKKKSK